MINRSHEERFQCSLILFPLSPLEYHGPHMPVGVDAINASRIAHECCRRLKKSVVRPTLTIGTECEREPELLESLGFDQGSYIVGMDFPSRLWNSHYMREEIFAIVLAEELRRSSAVEFIVAVFSVTDFNIAAMRVRNAPIVSSIQIRRRSRSASELA